MENFATVVRTLLDRIRALRCCRSDNWPPSAAATAGTSPYRVAPTTWGVSPTGAAPPDPSAPDAPKPSMGTPHRTATRRRRRGLEISIYGLPVPRGLPAT